MYMHPWYRGCINDMLMHMSEGTLYVYVYAYQYVHVGRHAGLSVHVDRYVYIATHMHARSSVYISSVPQHACKQVHTLC